MDYTHPQFHPQLKQLAQTIDQLDYFQILNLPYDATPVAIKQSYFDQSRSLHPDKFYHLPDEELRQAVHKIYKRITEAYVVLKVPEKRTKYVTDVTGPERDAKLRFTEAAEEEVKKEQAEAREVCKTEKGKKVWREVQIALRDEQWDKAFRMLQTVALYEPKNEAIVEIKAKIDRLRKGLPAE